VDAVLLMMRWTLKKNPKNSSLALMLPCIDDSISDKLIAQIGGTIQSFIIEFEFCNTIYVLMVDA
jgi:hypothetical protein